MKVITWNDAENVRSYLCYCGSMVGGIEDGVERQELLVQIAHRYNNFMRALAALKDMAEFGLACDQRLKASELIKELEEVR